MAVEILPPAETRLVEIWTYTKIEGGQVQADRYLRGLAAEIRDAARRRKNWKRFPDAEIRGVFYLRYRHHRIFFREFSDGVIGVIAILHESMDLTARLREDAEQIEE
jgi:plasmid stabilization system protein ParE